MLLLRAKKFMSDQVFQNMIPFFHDLLIAGTFTRWWDEIAVDGVCPPGFRSTLRQCTPSPVTASLK